MEQQKSKGKSVLPKQAVKKTPQATAKKKQFLCLEFIKNKL